MLRNVAVLLVAVLALAIAGNARPWKRLQDTFLELEREQIRARLDAAREQATLGLAEVEAEIQAERQRLTERSDEILDLEDDLRRFRGKLQAAETRRSLIGSDLEQARWRLRGEPSGAEQAGAEQAGAEQVIVLEERLRETRKEVESLTELAADREGKLGAARSLLNAALERQALLLAPIEELESRLEELRSGPLPAVPGLYHPGVSVREIRVADFPELDGTTRLDRCVTCHLGADRGDPSGEGRPPPFRPHPDLDLFVGADSPHPAARFGCTVCHGGDGRATDYARAGHLPGEVPSRRPILPLELTEAACGSCHGAEVWTPRAPTHDAGWRLISTLGCTGCHTGDPLESGTGALAGPALLGIASKTSPAWAYRWIEGPSELDSAARMPHFFDLDSDAGSDAGAEQRARRRTEVRAIVHYLWERSRSAAQESPPEGDPVRGKELLESVGCLGCHLLDPASTIPRASERRHGPNLARVGSKIFPTWLFAWLRDPSGIRHDTPMPSLRLDEQEAADLVAYLMTRRDPAWESLELPEVTVEVRDALLLGYLEESHTVEESQARLDRMSDRERNVSLGEQTIANRGCHGCHRIAGFEDAKVAGPGLGEMAANLRQRWRPEAHDPVYSLTEDEARAVTVAMLGRTFAHARPALPRSAGGRSRALAAGRRVIERYNCRGCHLVENRGGAITAATVEAGSAPPDLTHSGARLRSPWLHDYLADPGRSSMRPWLTVRMPTFAFTEAERNALVRYFAALNDRELFTVPRRAEDSSEVDLTVGKVVFGMLQCDDCHDDDRDAPLLAPPYHRARERLRPDWVVEWILDPEAWSRGTAMPAVFRAAEGEPLDSSFLSGSISTPIYSPERGRLLRLFESEEDLHAYLSDPRRVAAALRDHLWTMDK
ncbi:MAG: c-type cytochrome [bacterium]|nr:c-type cytochrome [bacterium]